MQLESERLLAEGIEKGIEKGRIGMLVALVKDGTISIQAALEKAEMTEEEFREYM